MFLMSFSKPQVSFSSNIPSLFGAMKDNSYGPIKVKILRISSARVKIHQICVTLETATQFFFEFCINLET